MKFLSGLWLVWASVVHLCACGTLEVELPDNRQRSVPGSVGGGQSAILHIPFPAGTMSLCTQGAKDSFSHKFKFTCYDLDFDTSNAVREEIFAPVSGKVYVFDAILTGSSFGTHLNIDLGNGMYVVVAHLDKPLVCNGCEVSVGELIGIEGCTGACTGDHVHIGLHKGDAKLPAEHGESIEATYMVAEGTMTSTQFVCGTGSSDNDPMGESYTSLLPVVQTHPDGTLVKTDHNPKVYLLEGGQRRWILNEQVFWSHGYNFNEVVVISDEELDCYSEGQMIAEIGLVDAVTDPSGLMWLVVGPATSLDRYRIQLPSFGWQGVLATWGLSYSVSKPPPWVAWEHPYLSQWAVAFGTAKYRVGALVKEVSSSAVYVSEWNTALPIKNWQTYLMLGFLTRTIVVVEDGSMLAVQQNIGDCVSGVNCLSVETVSVCGNDGFVTPVAGQGGPIQPSQSSDRTPEQTQASEPSTPERTPSREPAPTPSQPAQTVGAVCASGEFVCLADLDADGLTESLLMTDQLWVSQMLMSTPAYVYGNGGCFGGDLLAENFVFPEGGYYRIDFSQFAFDCSSEFTLVASIGFDGNPPFPDQSNWAWWQSAGYCAKGSSLCNLMNNGKPWEEWLLSVAWHPLYGLIPTGNGFTINAQL